jgi:predicted nucleotidyltransferase
LVRQVVIDGSFVTDEPKPNDVDLIIVIPADSELKRDLLPGEYNVLSKKRVRAQFGFDVVAVRENTVELDEAIAFFEQVRGRPNLRKGIIKLTI